MTSKERLLAAIRCEEVDYVPISMHFWHDPRHARASWRNQRERLALYQKWGWDTTAGVSTHVSPSPEVRVEVSYETADGTAILHQTWHTPAGSLEEKLKVTDDWDAARKVTHYLPFLDDFRASRYLKVPVKGPEDIPALEYIFPVDNADDTDAMVRGHRAAWALADEFQVPLCGDHAAGMDWLTWLWSADGAVLQVMDNRPLARKVLAVINAAHQRRLELLLELGVDMVERRGWYESADYWSPAIVDDLARPVLEAEIEATHRCGAVHVYLMDTGIVPLLPMLASLPFDCLLGAEPAYGRHDLEELRRRLPGKSLWSGISGPEHLGRGTPESVERAVERAFAECGRIGFILGAAVGIRYDWPEENLLACERAWRRLR